jgi:hypothetical protein
MQRPDRAGTIYAMYAAIFEHTQRFCEELILTALRKMLDEIFGIDRLCATAGEWPHLRCIEWLRSGR